MDKGYSKTTFTTSTSFDIKALPFKFILFAYTLADQRVLFEYFSLETFIILFRAEQIDES